MIIVTGKNGFIGSRLIDFLQKKITGDEIIGTTRDTTDPNALYLDLNDISNFNYSLLNEGDVLIHTAANSSPDQCHNDFDNVYNVNVINTIALINRCIEKKVKVIFFSSDTVYGESHNEFDESKPLNPLGHYAEMKVEVEENFSNSEYVRVFHLSYVFDREDKYMTYLMKCYNEHKKAEVFSPFDRSVVYMKDVLEAVFSLIIKWDKISAKCINLCGPELLSRQMITQFFSDNVDSGLEYQVIVPADDFFKARPRVINMQSRYLSKLLGRSACKINEAMKTELRGE